MNGKEHTLPEKPPLPNATLGEQVNLSLSEQANAISTRADFSAFLDNWLYGPNRQDECEGVSISPILNALAWCLSEMDTRCVDCVNNEQQLLETPSWRLFGQILYAAIYFGTSEYEAWLDNNQQLTVPECNVL